MAKEIKIEHKGTVKHILEDDRAKKITVRLILAWIFSIVFILAGLGSFVNASIGSGVCFLLAGLVLFPPIDKALRNNYNFYFSSWLKFFIVLILIIVAGSLAVSHNVANSYSNKPVSDVAGGSDVSGIAPKQQVNTLYSQADAKDAIAEGKGMANSATQEKAFTDKYSIKNNGATLVMFTPYANTAMTIAKAIEKYDTYTLESTESALNSNNIYTTAFNVVTSKAYYKYVSSDDLRAVIEYDNGQVCRGTIDDVNSEIGQMDSSYNYNYVTSVSATFNCFTDVRDKTVNFVYVFGNEGKISFSSINMANYK